MQITRRKILEYLINNPGTSAGELGRVLEMTPANIRYHLDLLLENDEVQISGQRPAGGAGRPIYLYNLSSKTLGDSIFPLLEVIFETLPEHPDSDEILEKIVSNLVKNHLPEDSNPITRYNKAIGYLNKLNYHASWDARPDGPRVELRHCPYRDLALDNPLICQVDQKLLSRLFQIPLKLAQKRTFGNNPFSPCIFKPPPFKGEKGFTQKV